MMNESEKSNMEHILDLTIKAQSSLIQGRIYSAGQFIEEIRYILEHRE